MFTLKKTGLPQTIDVGGSFFRIHTDYRFFLRFREHLQEKDAELTAFDYMYVEEKPASRLEGLRKLVEFMNPPQERICVKPSSRSVTRRKV